MTINSLPNFDIESITDVDTGVNLIAQNLAILKSIATAVDFTNLDERKKFIENIIFIKRYYERVDSLLGNQEVL